LDVLPDTVVADLASCQDDRRNNASTRICCKGNTAADSGKGYFFPFGGDAEHDWDNGLRIVLYFLGLVWCFMGVAIVADIFMQAIERVTSTEKKVWVTVAGQQKQFHVRVWNDTVANLSLMALGSSAPEILLNVLGIVGKEFYSEELGPSTIVGSAAFNLLVISAVCVVAIKSPDVRRINDTLVYSCTAFFSIFAYLWLVIILMLWTPDIVSVEEATITFLFFPLLVGLAYAFDVGYFENFLKKKRAAEKKSAKVVAMDEEIAADSVKIAKLKMLDDAVVELASSNRKRQSVVDPAVLKKVAGKILENNQCSATQAVKLADLQLSEERAKSRAYYRIAGTRTVLGGKHPVQLTPQGVDAEAIAGKAGVNSALTVGFVSPLHGVLESQKKCQLEVERQGMKGESVTVKFETRNGTAIAGQHYKARSGVITFEPMQTCAKIEVELIDDSNWTADSSFFVHLIEAVMQGKPALIDGDKQEVVIVDDDDPGILAFSEEKVIVKENKPVAVLTVLRRRGRAGRVTCQFTTKDGSAVAPTDYVHTSGELVFEHGEAAKNIEVQIVDDDVYEKDESFTVCITDVTGGAVFDATTDGSDSSCICEVTIVSDEETKKLADHVLMTMHIDRHKLKIGADGYMEQFRNALTVSSDENNKPSMVVYILHVISFPWKFGFAFIPPVQLGGGWPAFFFALGLIGVVTSFISDLASLLGCCLGIKDSITAITLVAMGTSLPDTFASKQAAEQDPYADASIGNITGSNSVNVFLGLGLPWLIGSIYWAVQGRTADWEKAVEDTYLKAYNKEEANVEFQKFLRDNPDGGFYVRAGDLGFSVVVFCCCALVCLGVLALRRKAFGGELGGPFLPKVFSAGFFVLLWAIYILISILKTEKVI
jgi:solute carrier family 8 (sodium/calcium exchanger)